MLSPLQARALRSRARTCAQIAFGPPGSSGEIECAPGLRQRIEQHILERPDQADEQRLARAGSLLDLDCARERGQAARLIARGVFAQRRLDDVVIARFERDASRP